ncbi:hypothetical protein PR048_007578 [Dryococelus australis]|uniref:Uncharacterized protein n=1 Tax=Dryococelus australis TaxID=614101 RepID=A0ABQ9HUM1_9NEOP|nr:hypothetical protein PR048_007578 [Dryococelus australis]
MKGRGKREIPEKTRRPKASPGTIPTCEDLVTRPGDRTRFALAGGERANRSATVASYYTLGFPHVGIGPDDVAGRRVFSGLSRFPRPCIPGMLRPHLASPPRSFNNPADLSKFPGQRDGINICCGACRRSSLMTMIVVPRSNKSSVIPLLAASPLRGRKGVTSACIEFKPARGLGGRAVSLLASQPSRTGFIPRSDQSRIFGRRETHRTMVLICEFSRGFPVSPALPFRRCSVLTSITLIGSEDPAVKSRPYLYTHPLTHSIPQTGDSECMGPKCRLL